jgi:hypothetical protein
MSFYLLIKRRLPLTELHLSLLFPPLNLLQWFFELKDDLWAISFKLTYSLFQWSILHNSSLVILIDIRIPLLIYSYFVNIDSHTLRFYKSASSFLRLAYGEGQYLFTLLLLTVGDWGYVYWIWDMLSLDN